VKAAIMLRIALALVATLLVTSAHSARIADVRNTKHNLSVDGPAGRTVACWAASFRG